MEVSDVLLLQVGHLNLFIEIRQILIILQKHTSLIPLLMLALVPMLAWATEKVRIVLRSH